MASIVGKKTLEAPIKDKVLESTGLISRVWQDFTLKVQNLLTTLGEEKSFTLANNQVSSTPIEGLSFDKSYVSYAAVDYLIQRVTTGTGATELAAGGTFYLVYFPTSAAWSLYNGPTTVGVTLLISTAGQVKYLSTNITGTASISKIYWRARTLSGKNHTYSLIGGGR